MMNYKWSLAIASGALLAGCAQDPALGETAQPDTNSDQLNLDQEAGAVTVSSEELVCDLWRLVECWACV